MPRKTTEERFWQKVVKSDGCWLWTAARNAFGYGSMGLGPGNGTGLAHRYAYELLVGPIAEGLTIDHLCRVRHCVNPEHLEAVTYQENRRREVERHTHCKNGHEMTPENIRLRADRPNARGCRACESYWRSRKTPRPHIPSLRERRHGPDGRFYWVMP